MYRYIDEMERRMTADEKDMLQRIYAPTVVGVPPGDARRHLCILKDGEIRAYEMRHTLSPADGNSPPLAYLSSRDGGISWKRQYAKGKMGPCTYIERGDLYIATVDFCEGGLYVYRSSIGPDDEAPEIIRVSELSHGGTFLPQQSPFSERIWFTSQRRGTGALSEQLVAVFYYSDDLGKTWSFVEIPRREGWEIEPPHRGMRWSIRSGVEPYAEEIGRGKMMMLIRSPYDSFYVSYSEDAGESWSEPTPSDFYGTNTTAFLLRMRDGRILSFWNNTVPLPQADPKEAIPALNAETAAGIWEDVFTNRDAAHAAISEDGGKTFLGYREILLNPIRNRTDFRYLGDPVTSRDKSVHQFQAFELPFGKILVSVGQNEASRRLVILDAGWLYESERREDFLTGLSDISHHTYLKSVSGCTVRAVGNGHCAWNRMPSACLYPSPDGTAREVLYLCKRHDPRRTNDISGAVWNFPLSVRGRVTLDLYIVEKQAEILLSDRWYNPCDPSLAMRAPFRFTVDAATLGTDFTALTVAYDTEKGEAELTANGKPIATVPLQRKTPLGICYLILQCNTEGESDGFFVRSLAKTAE